MAVSASSPKSPARDLNGNSGFSTATSRRRVVPSSAKTTFLSLREQLKTFTQVHPEEDGKKGERQNQLPPKPSPAVRRMSSVSEKRIPAPRRLSFNESQGVVKEKLSDTRDWLNSTAAKASLLAGVCNKSTDSRHCYNPLEGLCFSGAKQESEDGQSEISIASSRPRQRNIVEAERIMVYVRVRPLSKKEMETGASSCVHMLNNNSLTLSEFAAENDYLRLKRNHDKHYTFDGVFAHTVDQQEVYNTSAAELVDGVLQGRNGSVFCYGATGSGKTYTMLGTDESPGVMVLAIKDLFEKIKQWDSDDEHMVQLSYLEVYNETVKDLLSPGKSLHLREDKQGTMASGVTQHKACSLEEVMALLRKGNRNRTTEPTRINETSSRSHAILQVVLQYKVKEGSTCVIRTGKLSLVDLAGSERAIATDQLTQRSVEGANINRSLLALISCINALVEGKRHIPYRNSKLTQLLKDSLGGACQTAMIANISPSNLCYSETLNTVHWADRAKGIRTKPCIPNEEHQTSESEIVQNKLLIETQKENQLLKSRLAELEEEKQLSIQSQKVTTTPSVPCSSLFPHSPFTPPATVQIHNSRLPSRDNGKFVEDTIQELRRKVETLQDEFYRIKTENAMEKLQLTASLMSQKAQLKNKDDIIRRLSQGALPVNQVEHDAPGPEEMKQGNDSVLMPERVMSPKQTPTKVTSDSDNPKLKSYQRARRLSDIEAKNPSSNQKPYQRARRLSDVEAINPSGIFSSPATGKKRAFWDITNNNSPGAITNSPSRINTSDAPSMLLKPGFSLYDPPN